MARAQWHPFIASALIAAPLAILCSGGATAEAGAPAAKPLKVVIAVGPNAKAMAKFRDYLTERYAMAITYIEAGSGKPIPGIEALQTCDVFVSNLRRTKPTPEQLAVIKQYVAAGKPVVGLRRAHHGFQTWLEADKAIFGVQYGGHGGGGKQAELVIPEDQKQHPLVAGLKPFMPGGGLYDHSQLEKGATVLMASIDRGKTYPQMWTIERTNGQRIFYTRFDPSDVMKDAGVRAVVVRAIFWAARRSSKRAIKP